MKKKYPYYAKSNKDIFALKNIVKILEGITLGF